MLLCIFTNRFDITLGGYNSMNNNYLDKHLNKNLSRQKSYLKEIISLPKGKIVLRKMSSEHYYYYLLYRDQSKIKNSYIGPAQTTDIDALQVQINRRNFLKKALKILKSEEKEIRKANR